MATANKGQTFRGIRYYYFRPVSGYTAVVVFSAHLVAVPKRKVFTTSSIRNYSYVFDQQPSWRVSPQYFRQIAYAASPLRMREDLSERGLICWLLSRGEHSMRDLHSELSCCLAAVSCSRLFQSMVVQRGKKSVDNSFCLIYSITLWVISFMVNHCICSPQLKSVGLFFINTWAMLKRWVSKKSLSEIAGMMMMMMMMMMMIQQHAKQQWLYRVRDTTLPLLLMGQVPGLLPLSTDFIVLGFDDSLSARKPVMTALQRRGFGNLSGGR